jgi:hypothetical protein
LILWLDQRGGEWREKHYFDIGMKITNKRGCPGELSRISKILKRMQF